MTEVLGVTHTPMAEYLAILRRYGLRPEFPPAVTDEANSFGKVVTKARITVVMNGVKVQDGSEYIGPSSHKVNPPYKKHDGKLPLGLQWHGDVVEFRNLWILPDTKAGK